MDHLQGRQQAVQGNSLYGPQAYKVPPERRERQQVFKIKLQQIVHLKISPQNSFSWFISPDD